MPLWLRPRTLACTPKKLFYLIKLLREIRSTISFPASKIAIVSTGVAGMHVQPVLESYLARSV
jgi:hypothetical protein